MDNDTISALIDAHVQRQAHRRTLRQERRAKLAARRRASRTGYRLWRLSIKHERMQARLARLVDGVQSGEFWGMTAQDVAADVAGIAADDPEYLDADTLDAEEIAETQDILDDPETLAAIADAENEGMPPQPNPSINPHRYG